MKKQYKLGPLEIFISNGEYQDEFPTWEINVYVFGTLKLKLTWLL